MDNLADFEFEIPENLDLVLESFKIADEDTYKEFLVPISYTKNRLVQAQPFFYK